MTAFIQHFTFEFKSGLRNATSMLMNYLFPLAFYAMMGLVMVQINPGFKETFIPAIILVALMAGTLLGLPGPLVEQRDAGIFRSFKINGVPAASILLIPALTTIFHTLIASALIALTAGPLFGVATPSSWLALAGVTLLTAFSLGAAGALIGVVAAGARAVVLWSQLIFLPSMLLGGLMIPLSMLPESVRPVAALLPTTYAMQAYHGFAFNQPTQLDPALSLVVLAAAGLLAFGLAMFLFNWDSRNQTRRGHPLLALLAWLPYVLGALLLAR